MMIHCKTQVAGTNDWSISSKYSIVTSGYVTDDFLGYFAKDLPRSPIINRGYYVRHRAIHYGFQEAFLESHTNVVISLGAGFDTSAFRYPEQFFIEIDYPSNCLQKAKIVIENNLIDDSCRMIASSEDCGVILTSKRYILIGADLRKPEQLRKILSANVLKYFDFQLPMNFILFNECSLCYIDQESSDNLLKMLMQILVINCEELGMSKVKFTYLGYEMYRSQSCENDFHKVMLSHFESIGAPILTFQDESGIQERFKNILGFDSVRIDNMRFYMRNCLNQPPECERIKQIEPFDEWEELDNVCASYSLTIASKNYNLENQTLEYSSCSKSVKIPISSEKVYNDFPVFGHCSSSENREIYVFGGFGKELSSSIDCLDSIQSDDCSKRFAHTRLSNIVRLELQSEGRIQSITPIKPQDRLSSIKRVHARVVRLKEEKFLLSGGRTSPKSAKTNSIIEISGGQFLATTSESLNRIKDNASVVPGTFRHVCAKFGNETNRIIQFGGIQTEPNESAFVFDIDSESWCTQKISKLDTRRHSSAFSSFRSNSVLLHGGLDWRDNYLKQTCLELIDYRQYELNQFEIQNYNFNQYSHCMKTINDNEILIVGGLAESIIGNFAFRIDIRSMAILRQYRFDSKIRLLLHNFACELIPAESGSCLLYLLGGGGNCFSFGTHFNPILLYQV